MVHLRKMTRLPVLMAGEVAIFFIVDSNGHKK